MTMPASLERTRTAIRAVAIVIGLTAARMRFPAKPNQAHGGSPA